MFAEQIYRSAVGTVVGISHPFCVTLAARGCSAIWRNQQPYQNQVTADICKRKRAVECLIISANLGELGLPQSIVDFNDTVNSIWSNYFFL